MSLPSNGLTAEVIRNVMPPYHLSADLRHAAFATLPPHHTCTPWRHARSTRLIQEIGTCKPTDAGQARIVALLRIVCERTTRRRPPSTPHHPGRKLPPDGQRTATGGVSIDAGKRWR